MALKTYPDVPVYTPMLLKSVVATADQATAGEVEIAMERPITNVIAQIQADATGAVNNTGLTVEITTVTTAGSESCTVTVGATTITEGDIVNIIAW